MRGITVFNFTHARHNQRTPPQCQNSRSTGLALPLFLLFASPLSSAPKAFGATKENPESQGQTGTLQKMIGQSGSVTMQLDLNRSNGIATPCIGQYVFQQIGDSIVPGTTDSGNHGDNQVTNIPLPFSYTLYDQAFNSINVSSNGNAQFTTTDTAFTNVCPLPWTGHDYTIFPYWDDQRTDANTGCSAFPGGNLRCVHVGFWHCAQPDLQYRMAHCLLR